VVASPSGEAAYWGGNAVDISGCFDMGALAHGGLNRVVGCVPSRVLLMATEVAGQRGVGVASAGAGVMYAGPVRAQMVQDRGEWVYRRQLVSCPKGGEVGN